MYQTGAGAPARPARLRDRVPGLARDGIGIAGAALVSYGAWLVYQPAGLIVCGALLLAGAWLWQGDEGPGEGRPNA